MSLLEGNISNLELHLQELGIDTSLLDIDTIPITLPSLKYGYTQIPLTWEQLRRILLVDMDLAKLSRSEAQQRKYELFRHFLKQKYKSMLDYVLVSKFKFERRVVGGDDHRWNAFPSLKDDKTRRRILIPNDFPYHTAKNVVHYVLWKTNADVTSEDIEDAKIELSELLDYVESIHWVNPPYLKSLPEIDHAHILCLLKEE